MKLLCATLCASHCWNSKNGMFVSKTELHCISTFCPVSSARLMPFPTVSKSSLSVIVCS